MKNRKLNRFRLEQLCEQLGHDPERVSEIVLTPTEVRVTYVHEVTTGLEE